jgi:hypothetical protein
VIIQAAESQCLFNSRLDRNFWPDMLISWGYAILLVDSFSLRRMDDFCDRDASYFRVHDDYEPCG